MKYRVWMITKKELENNNNNKDIFSVTYDSLDDANGLVDRMFAKIYELRKEMSANAIKFAETGDEEIYNRQKQIENTIIYGGYTYNDFISSHVRMGISHDNNGTVVNDWYVLNAFDIIRLHDILAQEECYT